LQRLQARHVILRVLLEAGEGLIAVEPCVNPENGKADVVVSLDRSKIKTIGREAIASFLRKLQVYNALLTPTPAAL